MTDHQPDGPTPPDPKSKPEPKSPIVRLLVRYPQTTNAIFAVVVVLVALAIISTQGGQVAVTATAGPLTQAWLEVTQTAEASASMTAQATATPTPSPDYTAMLNQARTDVAATLGAGSDG